MSCLVVVGCGRIAFDPRSGDSGSQFPDALQSRDGSTANISFGEQPGATYMGVTRDTFIRASDPANNYGSDDTLEIGPSRSSVIRFDLSMLPPTSTISAAELRITVEFGGLSGAAEMFRVLEDWNEGSEIAMPGVANYTMRTAALPWSNAGAQGPTSRAASPSASFLPSQVDTTYFVSLDRLVVQSWVADPATNFGITIESSSSGACDFGSQGNAVPERRPVLFLTIP